MISTNTRLQGALRHPHFKFHQNKTIQGWVLGSKFVASSYWSWVDQTRGVLTGCKAAHCLQLNIYHSHRQRVNVNYIYCVMYSSHSRQTLRWQMMSVNSQLHADVQCDQLQTDSIAAAAQHSTVSNLHTPIPSTFRHFHKNTFINVFSSKIILFWTFGDTLRWQQQIK